MPAIYCAELLYITNNFLTTANIFLFKYVLLRRIEIYYVFIYLFIL